MPTILAINGSYRDDGSTDQLIHFMTDVLRDNGANVETIFLRDYPIEFCLNCRECTQQPGSAPGVCVQHDGMQALVDKIEKCDAYIFASPTNFGSVTAIFKRFMERLVVYGYWPWGEKFPKFRKTGLPQKKAVIVTSCAAPSIIGRFFYETTKQLKTAAKTIGAKPVGTLYTGMVSQQPHADLSEKMKAKASALAMKLV